MVIIIIIIIRIIRIIIIRIIVEVIEVIIVIRLEYQLYSIGMYRVDAFFYLNFSFVLYWAQ